MTFVTCKPRARAVFDFVSRLVHRSQYSTCTRVASPSARRERGSGRAGSRILARPHATRRDDRRGPAGSRKTHLATRLPLRRVALKSPRSAKPLCLSSVSRSPRMRCPALTLTSRVTSTGAEPTSRAYSVFVYCVRLLKSIFASEP